MIVTHDIDQCFADRIGDGGLDRRDFDATLKTTARALHKLRDQAKTGGLPLLAVPGKSDDLTALEPIVRRFRDRFDDVVVLGTGGSSLGGQTLAALTHWPPAAPRWQTAQPRVHFMDNIDPASFATLYNAVDLSRTGVIVISKSGSTAETATQFFHTVAEITSRVGETIDIIRHEWAKLRDEGVSDKDLADAKTFLTGSFLTRISSTGRMANLLLGIQLEDLGIDYIDKRNGYIDAVTQEDIRRVAKRLLEPGKLTFVIVGAPEGVKATAKAPEDGS
jgi:hypothetical protein